MSFLLITPTTDKIARIKEVLIDICGVFTSQEWSEIQEKTQSIAFSIDIESRHISFDFTIVNDENRYLSKQVLDKFLSFERGGEYRKCITLNVIGYKWEKSDLTGLITSVPKLSHAKVSIDPDSPNNLTIHVESPEVVNQHHYYFISVLNFLLHKQVQIFVDYKQQVEPEPPQPSSIKERRNITSSSSFDQSGDFCCFKLEARADHGGNKKYKVGFTNLKQYYWLSIANRKNETDRADKIFNQLQVNKWYRVRFSLNSSGRFSDVIDGFVNEIEPLPKHRDGLGRQVKKDETEFGTINAISIHTKSSAFDGLYSVDDFVEEAVARGHKAIGIADQGSVQSFSLFERSVSKAGIKGIYGTELEIIGDKIPIIIGGYSENWEGLDIRIGDDICKGWDGESYCVLDIETTGLHAFKDDIIQIAAKKFSFHKNSLSKVILSLSDLKKKGGPLNVDELTGVIVTGTFNYYIKTDKKIGAHIEELTHITQEQIDNEGVDPVYALKELKKFVKGSIIVAHNGIDFDIPFINAHLRKRGLKELEETTLDTTNFSRYLFSEKKFKSHALSALAKKASITYNEEEAHNAIYDVDVLSALFFGYMLPNLKEETQLEVDRLQELNEYFWNKKSIYKNIWGDNALIYVKKQEGVKNLYELVSLAHTKYYSDSTKLCRNELTDERRENLLLISDPLLSERGFWGALMKHDRSLFRRFVKWFDYVIIPPPSHFIHLVSTHKIEKDEVILALRELVRWCEEDEVKWFFSGTIRYIDKERDYERYSVLVNTKGIAGRRHYLNNRDSDDLPILDFKYTEDLINEYAEVWEEDEWMRLVVISMEYHNMFINSIDDNIEVIKKTLHSPKIDKCNDLLREVCEKKMKERYGKNKKSFFWKRYEKEIKGIIDNDFSVIYWFSHLLVKKSHEDGYLVGSRGSVGSSFVAYLAGISEVNPLPPHYFCSKCSVFDLQEDWQESGFDLPDKKCEKCGEIMGKDGHDIPFETFLGFDGNKVPDIDLNFSGEYQLHAHNFLLKYFGEEKVFRAGTIGTMADKTAAAVVEKYREEKDIKDWSNGKKVWLADKIVDVKRTTGQHPGGILVVPNDRSIYEFSPINYPANDTTSTWYTTHFAFEDLHDSLLKFDILGHDDPTTLKLLKELTGFDPVNVPIQDEKLIKLYGSCEVMGISSGSLIGEETTGAIGLPEFGTTLTRKIIKACNPQTFADLIRISGFSHGTGVWRGNIDGLVQKGQSLNSVITCRDDIMLYLMRQGLNREDAFNITESIRKGRGLSDEFQTLMKDKGIPEWYIESSKKISYIFPKAHATAYVLMSWRIAYYKLYYPLAFYSSYFTTSVDSFDLSLLVTNDMKKLKERYESLSKEIKKPGKSNTHTDKAKLIVYEVAYEFLARGFKFTNVCVNKSELSRFVPVNETNELIIPLKAVVGCGEHLAAGIVEGRRTGGVYRTLQDLQERGGVKTAAIGKLRKFGILPDDVPLNKEIFDEKGNRVVGDL